MQPQPPAEFRRSLFGRHLLAVTIAFAWAVTGCGREGTPHAAPPGTQAVPPSFDDGDHTVVVRFSVLPPDNLPSGAVLHLSGNLPALGGVWKPDSVALRPGRDGRWRTELRLPRGATLRYKLTLGSWGTVEKSADGRDIENRSLQLDSPSGDLDVQIAVPRFGDATASTERVSTITGDVRFHHDFRSRHLNNHRNLAVYLPPGYDRDADRRYPVLYMHDGQNVFDDRTSFAGEWRADETAERLIADGTIQPLIIVAVDNAGVHRMAEYTPTVDPRWGIGGRADLYTRFLLEEVKPFIDQTYRTLPGRDDTAVCGSSLGGLVSLHIARTRPDLVGRCAAVSPSLWWHERNMLRDLAGDAAWTASCRIWFDMGTAEDSEDASGRNVANTRELARILEAAGRQPGVDFRYLEVEGGRHSESDWADRFDQVLTFLFPSE